jgi:hypothetical protein
VSAVPGEIPLPPDWDDDDRYPPIPGDTGPRKANGASNTIASEELEDVPFPDGETEKPRNFSDAELDAEFERTRFYKPGNELHGAIVKKIIAKKDSGEKLSTKETEWFNNARDWVRHKALMASLNGGGGNSQTAADGRTEEAWPELEDITVGADPVPQFPTELLPYPFRAFVEDIADRLQVPPCYPAIPTLISVATMLGREMRLQPKKHDNDWTERACLWGVLVGPVSQLKTPATQAALVH